MNAVNYKGFVLEQRMLGMSSQGAITTDIISDKWQRLKGCQC